MEAQVFELLGKLNVGLEARQIVQPLFALFRDENFAPNLAAWMVISAIAFGAFFHYQATRACLRLHKIIRLLRRIPDPRAFASEFPTVDKAISRVRWLRHGWVEFQDTLVEDETGGTLQNTVRPAEFINLLDAERSGLRLRWFQPLPGVFVGVGLLLTFAGLVAALFFASQGISADPAAPDAMKRMQEALVSLLSAATFKFWTSVAGLLSSICLGFVHRFGVTRVQHRFERLCNELERCMVVLTTEMIAQRQLVEAEQQGAQLREFNGQLAFTIGQGVEQALKATMPQIMNSAMEPVALQLREVTGNLGQMNQSALETMTADFGKVLQQSAGQEIRAVADTLSSTRGTLDGVGERISQATAGFEGAIGALREAAEALSHQVDGNADKAGATLDQQLKTTNDTLRLLADGISQTLSSVGDRLRTSSEEAGAQFSTQLAAAVERLNDAADRNAGAIREVADLLKSSATASSAAMGAGAEKAIAALAQAADRMAENVSLMATRVEQSSEAAAGNLLRTLDETVRSIQDATGRNSTLIAEAVAQIADASKSATDRVRADGEAIGTTLGAKAEEAGGKAGAAITGAADGLSEVLGAFGGKVDELARALQAVETRIAAHVDALSGVTKETRETETAMAGASRSLREAAEPFARSATTAAEAARSMATQVDKSASALVETQSQVRQVAENLQRMLEGAAASWRQYEDRFAGVDEALVRTITSVMDNFKANAEAVRDFVNKIDGSLGEAVSQFAGNIEELQESAELLDKSTQALEIASRNFLSQAAE